MIMKFRTSVARVAVASMAGLGITLAMAVFVATSLFTPGTAHATVYKCKNAKGQVEFSDAPCADGKTGSVVTVQPNTLDTSGERRAVSQEESNNRKTPLPARNGQSASAPTGGARRIDPVACQRAESQYQNDASTAGLAEGALEASKDAAQDACGTHDPRIRVHR